MQTTCTPDNHLFVFADDGTPPMACVCGAKRYDERPVGWLERLRTWWRLRDYVP